MQMMGKGGVEKVKHLCSHAQAVVKIRIVAAPALQQGDGAEDGGVGDEREAAAAGRLRSSVRPEVL